MAVFEFDFEQEDLADSLVNQTFQRLKPSYTELLLLCYEEALSYEEIAFLLEMKVDTVNTKLYRARKAFKKIYLEVKKDDESNI